PLAHVHAFSAHPQGGAGAVLAGHRQPRHCQRRARWRHPARGRCVVFHLPAETGVADSVAVAGIFVLADVPAHGHRLDRDYRFLAFAALSSELSRLRDGAPDLRRPRSGNGAGRSMARWHHAGRRVGTARAASLHCAGARPVRRGQPSTHPMILAWVERWLAQRRTREVFAALFFVVLLSLQLIGPVMGRYGDRSSAAFEQAGRFAAPVQALLPPGIAAKAVAARAENHLAIACRWLALLFAYAAAILRALSLRLRAQYRGENLSEVSSVASEKLQVAVPLGWQVPGLPGDVLAVLEKEVR